MNISASNTNSAGGSEGKSAGGSEGKSAGNSGSLLLHICCAPCSIYPVSVFQDEGMKFKGVFYNPNIHPREEFGRRRDTLAGYSAAAGFDVEFFDDYMEDRWLELPPTDERCAACYSLRLEKTAALAAQRGYGGFSTTLLASPYQKHELLKTIGGQIAAKYGVPFLYRDFREGYRQGQARAKELGLYRQKYCGCIISKRQREIEKISRKRSAG